MMVFKCVLLIFSLFLCISLVSSLAGLKIDGNKITADGKEIRLHGVSRSGTEFACVQGHGIFDGPNDQNSINVMKSWKINIVRIPLNEDCWLAINGVASQYAGQNYIQAIENFVNLFNQNGIYVILDLHWTAAGGTMATKQDPMPNKDHSIELWKQVATRFKSNPAVIFDLFNEPFPVGGKWDDTSAWQCWKTGGSSCQGLSYQAAGMQDLVDAVRSVGSTNICMFGGLAWSNSFAQWLQYLPTDSAKQTAASWHSYNFNYCNNEDCWNKYVLPVAEKYPVIVGEMGENDCNHGYIDSLMKFADANGIHYLAWTWNTWSCTDGPALITDYNGGTTNYGAGYKAHLLSL